MTPTDRDDPERDAWLREALRHAPDADAAPPATLSETILKQARAATAATPAPRATSPWSSAWAWLARPPVAAGFASVMAATLVGLMWWDRPMDEALPRPLAPELRRGTAPEAPLAAARDEVSPAVPAEAPNDVRIESKAATVATEPSRPAQRTPPEKSRRAAPADAASKKPSAAQRLEPEPFERERKEASVAAAPAPDAAPVPPTAPAVGAAAPAAPAMAETTKDAAPARQRAITGAAQERTAVARDELNAASAAASRDLAAGAFAKAAPPPAANALRLRQDEAADRGALLAETLASIASDAPRWSWRRGAGMQAMTPALQHWLVQLDAATESRWRAAPAAAASADGSTVRLYRSGALRATLHLDDDSVLFASPGAAAPTLRAALAPAAIAALKRGLDEATP